ncbi:MAG: aryl-alcohol dehydrogenase-like predicted oxidoreductase [Neolewinella sp.]|jgi:aryl-alcohol dehydrogenase-like predicted oxidoreductase
MENKFGLGTAAIGRPQYINIRQEKTATFSFEAFRQNGLNILDDAYNKGVRYFDTSPGYGMAEQILIDWLRGKDDEEIEVATKWGYTYVADFNPLATQHEVKEHSLKKLDEQWEKSKSLLPFLSVYQIHSATFETGVLDNIPVLRRLSSLREEFGIVLGITTSGANQVDVLHKAMNVEVDGKSLFDVFQVTYNVFDQDLVTVADEISKRNKRVVVKEALANGRVFPNGDYPQHAKAYRVLIDLAKKYEVGVDAIALRFCMDSIPVFKVLSGAANEGHLSSNLEVAKFKLDEEDIMDLKTLSMPPKDYWDERKRLGWN